MKDDYSRMVYKMAHSFAATTTVEFEEIAGEGMRLWMEALRSDRYDSSKSKFSTFLYIYLRDELTNFVKKQMMPVPLVDIQSITATRNTIDPEKQYIFKDMISKLSDDAKQVVRMIYQGHDDFILDGTESAHHVKGEIRRYLVDSGWTHAKTWGAINEVKAVLA